MSVYDPMSEDRWREAWGELSAIASLRSTILRMRSHRFGEHLSTIIQKFFPDINKDAQIASNDIIMDLLTECGFTTDDITAHLHSLGTAAWLLGYGYRDGEVPVKSTDDANSDSRVDDVPDWLYCQLRDEAAEAMIAQASDPSDYHRGLYDAAVEAFKAVSKIDGPLAENVILRRAWDLKHQDR